MTSSVMIPTTSQRFIVFGTTLAIDLSASVRSILGGDVGLLTQAAAKELFENIRCKAAILSFVTKPIVAIPLTITFVTAGTAFFVCILTALESLAASTLATVAYRIMYVAFMFFCGISARVIDLTIASTFTGFLSRVSTAYGRQREQAQVCLDLLRTVPRNRVRLVFSSGEFDPRLA